MNGDAHHMLLLTSSPGLLPDACYDADDEEEDDHAQSCYNTFAPVHWDKLNDLISALQDDDDSSNIADINVSLCSNDSDAPLPLVSFSLSSCTSQTDASCSDDSDPESLPPLISPSSSSDSDPESLPPLVSPSSSSDSSTDSDIGARLNTSDTDVSGSGESDPEHLSGYSDYVSPALIPRPDSDYSSDSASIDEQIALSDTVQDSDSEQLPQLLESSEEPDYSYSDDDYLPGLVSISSSSSETSDDDCGDHQHDANDSDSESDGPHCKVSLTSDSSDTDTSNCDDDYQRNDIYISPDDYEGVHTCHSEMFQIELEKELALLYPHLSDSPEHRRHHSTGFVEIRVAPSTTTPSLDVRYDVHDVPGRCFTHTQRGNPFDVNIITMDLLVALLSSYEEFDRRSNCRNFIPPFSANTYHHSSDVVVSILIITPGGDPPPPAPPPHSPSSSLEGSTTAEEAAHVAAQQPESDLPQVESFDNEYDMLADDVLLTINPDAPTGSVHPIPPSPPEAPQDPTHPPPPLSPPNAETSDSSATLPYNPVPRAPTKPRRKFKGHGWSSRGTKASRRREKAASKSGDHTVVVPPRLPPPLRRSPPSSGTDTEPSVSPTKRSYEQCEHPECARYPAKRKFAPGYFRFCFHHRHLNSPAPSRVSSKRNSSVSSRERPIPAPLAHSTVRDVTDHATSMQYSAEMRQRSLDIDSSLPRLRTARCTYAYAQGLHTVLHYPQQFLVTLRGEPAVRDDYTVAPCMK